MQKNVRLRPLVLVAAMLLFCLGCTRNHDDRTKGVYMLVGCSNTRSSEANHAAVSVFNRLLADLVPGDTLAVARIDTGRVSRMEAFARTTFDQRPSVMSAQKRLFRKQVAGMLESNEWGLPSDITGGLLQASQYLYQLKTGKKIVLIVSDLNAGTSRENTKEVPFHLDGLHVVAFDVTRRDDESYDPDRCRQQVSRWRNSMESGGASWQFVNSLDRLSTILAQ